MKELGVLLLLLGLSTAEFHCCGSISSNPECFAMGNRVDCESIGGDCKWDNNRCPDGNCGDRVQSAGETGVDCGGSCEPCPGPSCVDDIKNGEEQGVDCGGPTCPPCRVTCTDGVMNGEETGKDCGGPCAPCVVPSCENGVQDRDETGVDCGGRFCTPCPAANCYDGMWNQNEEGVDCGGDCVACQPLCGTEPFSWTMMVEEFTSVTSCHEEPIVVASANSCSEAITIAAEVLEQMETCLCPTKNTLIRGDLVCLENAATRPDGRSATNYKVTAQFQCCPYGPTYTCFDAKQNGEETGVDCGGPDCPPCTVPMDCVGTTSGWTMNVHQQAMLTNCNGNSINVQAAFNCNDAIVAAMNVYTQVIPCLSCGSSLTPVPAPFTCVEVEGVRPSGALFTKYQISTAYDCCSEATPIATCDNGVIDGEETDVDCGGPNCPPCPSGDCDGISTGFHMNVHQNPMQTNCMGATVPVAPATTCEEAIIVAQETFNAVAACLVCGSETASPGAFTCTESVGTRPTGSLFTYYAMDTTYECCGSTSGPTCEDGAMNGEETGVDCGGPVCSPCGPTCEDGAMNGEETGVDCGGPVCSPCAPTCEDGVMNGEETGVDCGGPDCSACSPGKCDDGVQNGQETGIDCGGPVCEPCDTSAPTCEDGVMNGEETGVDCGGPVCSPCGGPSCEDGVMNGEETGVDCGGPECSPCRPTCDDWIMNQDETDVDCGGDICPPCVYCDDGVQNGDEEGVDCGGTCPQLCASCEDGAQNGEETGIDCGGTVCPACDAATCSDDTLNGEETGIDCGGPECPPCREPSCFDGVMNGEETGVDCGGNCPPCVVASCDNGVQDGEETGVDCGGPACDPCPEPSCDDGVMNGNEFGVDCGGPCPACSEGCDGTTSGWHMAVEPNNMQTYCNGVTIPVGAAHSCVEAVAVAATTFAATSDCFGCSDGEVPIPTGFNCVENLATRPTGTTYINYQISAQYECCAGDAPGPSCTDGVQNGEETGVDCGGPDCNACPVPSDCVGSSSGWGMNVHQNNMQTYCNGVLIPVPAAMSCAEAIVVAEATFNAGIDCLTCGGDLNPTPGPFVCEEVLDTRPSGALYTKYVIRTGYDCCNEGPPAATCSDGLMNGDETGVDCGGDCAPCVTPTGCDGTTTSWYMNVHQQPMLTNCDGTSIDVDPALNCAEAMLVAEDVFTQVLPCLSCGDDEVATFESMECTETIGTRPTGSLYTKYAMKTTYKCCRDGDFVGCPEDEETCPDGTVVQRDPDNGCKFRPCPVVCERPSKTCSDGTVLTTTPALGCEFEPCPGEEPCDDDDCVPMKCPAVMCPDGVTMFGCLGTCFLSDRGCTGYTPSTVCGSAICDGDTVTCPDGTVVRRDPANDCKHQACKECLTTKCEPCPTGQVRTDVLDASKCCYTCAADPSGCNEGEEVDADGTCVKVSCDAKPCVAPQVCTPKDITCVTAPCPQFECTEGRHVVLITVAFRNLKRLFYTLQKIPCVAAAIADVGARLGVDIADLELKDAIFEALDGGRDRAKFEIILDAASVAAAKAKLAELTSFIAARDFDLPLLNLFGDDAREVIAELISIDWDSSSAVVAHIDSDGTIEVSGASALACGLTGALAAVAAVL